MSDLILLKDKRRCPKCFCRRSFRTGHCHNCGIMLFARPIDFTRFEADGNPRLYWLWTTEQGWIFRDHIMLGLQPLDRHIDLRWPEPNTKTAQERISEVRAKTKQQIRERTPKRNMVGYGKSKTALI